MIIDRIKHLLAEEEPAKKEDDTMDQFRERQHFQDKFAFHQTTLNPTVDMKMYDGDHLG